MPRVKWLRDEILLVAEVGLENQWVSEPPDEEIEAVSVLLRSGKLHAQHIEIDEKFRNWNGVKRKYYDLYTARSSYPGKRTNGGKTTLAVVQFLEKNPDVVKAEAVQVRKMLAGGSYSKRRIPGLLEE
ncbi:hypothetical protein ACTXN7_01685 [Corynebacterium flavescens]|uniref:hypothetical protein n=1 Tax=Corynebacterium flavescens TaxID=28028 RepID=UPI003FD5F4BE